MTPGLGIPHCVSTYPDSLAPVHVFVLAAFSFPQCLQSRPHTDEPNPIAGVLWTQRVRARVWRLVDSKRIRFYFSRWRVVLYLYRDVLDVGSVLGAEKEIWGQLHVRGL